MERFQGCMKVYVCCVFVSVCWGVCVCVCVGVCGGVCGCVCVVSVCTEGWG